MMRSVQILREIRHPVLFKSFVEWALSRSKITIFLPPLKLKQIFDIMIISIMF